MQSVLLVDLFYMLLSKFDFGIVIIAVVSWLFEVFAALFCRNLQHNPVYIPDYELIQQAWTPGISMLLDIGLLIVRIMIIFFICIPLAKLHGEYFFVGASVGLFVGVHLSLSIMMRFQGVNTLRMLIITGKEALGYGVLTSILIIYYKR